MLSQFLTDIGAASLSPSVDLPATPEDKPPFSALHDRLAEEIGNINDQTRQLLEQNWSDFQEQVADGKELLVRMEEEQAELTALEGELDGDRAFLPSLVERLTVHSRLAQTNSLATHTLLLIESLLALHSSILAVSNHTTAGSLPLAVASLRELQSALTRGAEPWIEQTDAWNALKRWAADEQVRLEGSVASALDGCFEFSPTTTTAGTTLALRSSIAAAPRGELLSVPVLLQALEDVFVMGGQGKRVEAQLARVSKQLLKYFVVPFLETNGRPDSDGQLDIAYAEERGVWTATIRPRPSASRGPAEDPLKEIAILLTFFAKHTHLFPPSPYAANFTANLTPTIQSLVVSSHLAPSLPASIDLISPYLNLLAAASTFESQFLSSAGYFAFLPKETHGQPREESRVIQSWVERVDKHWAGKVGDAALERVRDEIMRGDWSGEKMELEIEVEGEGGRMTKAKDKVLVSTRSKEIVSAADEVLDRAIAVGDDSFPHRTFAAASPLLLRTFISILSLYRAIVPVHHSALLAKDLGTSMQFANDTDWIGEQVDALWRKSKRGQSSSLHLDVEQALRTTRKLGQDWRERQIALQRESLMDSLDQANRFLYTADDSRYAACERALQQVTESLERLVKGWMPVMNTALFYSTLGNLVNEVLQRVLDEIMDQTDISEEESIRLNKLCKLLHGLESLFEGDVTSIGIEVPVWFKFVFLSELLEASMADILFLFDDGHLVDFEPDAIAKLVRALFSDSPLRNRNLEHILKGHPTVVPSHDDEDRDDSRATSPAPRHVAPVPRTPSPPPTPAPATRSGRQPLGTRIVTAKPSFPSPPPSPPPREPTPPPPPAQIAAARSPPAPSGPPEIDPELDASFDDVGDDAWDFSPIGSPSAEAPPKLPSPPHEAPIPSKSSKAAAVPLLPQGEAFLPPLLPPTRLVASPPVTTRHIASPPPSERVSSPIPVSLALPMPKPAPDSLHSLPPESGAVFAPVATSAAIAAATSASVVKSRQRSASISSSNGAEDAWGLDAEEEEPSVSSLPPEVSAVELPSSRPELDVQEQVMGETQGDEVRAEDADREVVQEAPTAEAEVEGDDWGLGEEESPAVVEEAEQDPSPRHGDASPEHDSPFEFDQVLPLAEQTIGTETVVDLPLADLLRPATPPHVDGAFAEDEQPPDAGQSEHEVQLASADEPLPAHAAHPSAENAPMLEDNAVERPASSDNPISERQPPTLEPSPFGADDASTSGLFGTSSSLFDNLGPSPFDSAGPSLFDNLGHEQAVEDSPHVATQPIEESSALTEAITVEPQPEAADVEEPHLEAPAAATPEHQEHALELTEALQTAQEEQAQSEPVLSPILHAEHTATIVHDADVELAPEEEGQAGRDLNEEWTAEEQMYDQPSTQQNFEEEIGEPQEPHPVEAVEESKSVQTVQHGEDSQHIEHAEEEIEHVQEEFSHPHHEAQHIEHAEEADAPNERSPSPAAPARNASPPLRHPSPPPRSPSPPPRSPSPPPRSPSPPHRSPSPPPREASPSPPPSASRLVEEEQTSFDGFIKMGAQEGPVSVEEPSDSTAHMFVNETKNDDEWTTYDSSAVPEAEVEPASPSTSPRVATPPIPPAFEARPPSPLVELGSSPEMIEHATRIPSPEHIKHQPVDVESFETSSAFTEEPSLKHAEHVEEEVMARTPHSPRTDEGDLAAPIVETDDRDELDEVVAEDDGDDWGISGTADEPQNDQDGSMEAEEDSPDSIPTPSSPVLSPLVDVGPAPTPLQHASPPQAASPPTESEVATPAHELHLDEEALETDPPQLSGKQGGYDSPALVPDEPEADLSQNEPPFADPEPKPEASANRLDEAETGGEGEEEEEDGGWGLDDELEGLEEAGEDDIIAPFAYTPVSPPRPLPYALPVSPPPRPRTPPQPTNGRFSSPARAMPSFFSPPFSPPRKQAPQEEPEEAEESGWGFDGDEEDDGGLGYMDDSPSNEAEQLGRSLYGSAPSAPLSPPPIKRGAHKAKQESVDDDAWGL